MSKVLTLSLTDFRYSILSEIAESDGGSVYDVVRKAIDIYLFEEKGYRYEDRSR